MNTTPKRIAIFASGTGSNAEKLIRYFKERSTAEVVWVGSNRSSAPVLDKAAQLGVAPTAFTKDALLAPDGVINELKQLEVDLIVLAGFLLMFPKHILDAYPDRVVNIHPALLPKYGGKGMYGMHVHRAVKEAGEHETGITIHLVNERYDEGAVLFQATVAVDETDTPEEIATKVQGLEHQHFPSVVENMLDKLPQQQ